MPRKSDDPTFLMNPWWRDWLLSAVLIGLGFMLSSPVAPFNGLIGYVCMALGAIIFLAAVAYTIWDALRRE